MTSLIFTETKLKAIAYYSKLVQHYNIRVKAHASRSARLQEKNLIGKSECLMNEGGDSGETI